MTIKFRPYQEKMISKIVDMIATNDSILAVAPTGSGKTVMFCEIIKRTSLKTLIIAHTKELIEQTGNKILDSQIPCSLVTARTIQSSQRFETLKRLSSSGYDLLIIDECHRSMAKSYRNLIESIREVNPKLRILGFTATPFRSDKQNLKEIFNWSVCSISLVNMIHEGYLCDFEGYRIKTKCSLTGISTKEGDFIASRLSSVINVQNRNDLIVKEYINISKGEKAIAFCASIAHTKDLKSTFQKSGIRCEALYGDITIKSRNKIIDDFRNGRIDVITNCNILVEGFDEPSVTTLLMCRPTLSKGLYMQMIGRGSRTFHSKEVCKVIEFTDNDYDVCQLEDLLDRPSRRNTLKYKERLTDFQKRADKELLYSDGITYQEKLSIIKKSTYSKKASPYQIKLLNDLKISFSKEISEHAANILISKGG